MQSFAGLSTQETIRTRAPRGSEAPFTPTFALTRLRHAATTRRAAIIALVAANVIWGTSFVVTKPVLAAIPPVTLAAERLACAVVLLMTFLLATGRRPVFNRQTALLGLIGIFLVYAFQNIGLQFTTAANSSLIQGGVPLFTALLAAPLLSERCGRGRMCELAVAGAGVIAVILGGSHGSIGQSTAGDALVVASALCLATRFTFGRRLFATGNALEILAGMTAFGLLFLLPASVVEVSVKGINRPPAIDLAAVAYLDFISSGVAFMLWAFGLRHLPAGHAASFANLNPLVGMVVAVLALGEAVTAVQVFGGALILAGVWLTARRPAQRHTRPEPVEALSRS